MKKNVTIAMLSWLRAVPNQGKEKPQMWMNLQRLNIMISTVMQITERKLRIGSGKSDFFSNSLSTKSKGQHKLGEDVKAGVRQHFMPFWYSP